MSTLALRFIITETGGKGRKWTQPAVAPTIELDNDPADYVVPVVAGATAILWAPTVSSSAALPADFAFLMLTTDESVMVEFTCNEGNANERVFAVALGPDWPLILTADDAYFNFTAGPAGDAFAGTLATLNKLRAKNLSTTDDAQVSVTIGS